MQTDERRLHNMPVALPQHIYAEYRALCHDGDLCVSRLHRTECYSRTLKRWVQQNPLTWEHAVLYGATEQRRS